MFVCGYAETFDVEVEFEEPEKVLNEDTLKEALSSAGEGSLEGIDLSSVGQLHLDNRQITKIDPVFLNKFTILEELNLSANRIREFPEDIRLVTLKKLDLHLNPMVSFSLKALLYMPALEEMLFDERPCRLVCVLPKIVGVTSIEFQLNIKHTVIMCMNFD